MRHSLNALAVAALSALALASCNDEPDYTGRVVVDLNRTVSSAAEVRSVLSDSARVFSLSADVNGVYSFVSDTLPSDIYVLSFDSAHALPLVVRCGDGQKVCGTIREWSGLSMSNAESYAAFQAEGMRRRLAVATDSALTAGILTSADGRRLAADSLAKVRAAFRTEADAMLRSLPDTSLAALPLLGMPGLYDDAADNDVLLRRTSALSDHWPELSVLARRCDYLRKVAKLNALRKTYATGKPAPDFLFISNAGDTLSQTSLAGKRAALALLPDSASTPRSVVSNLGILGLDGAAVLIQSPDGKVAPAGKYVSRGRFARLSHEQDVALFRPVVVVIAKDGTVERLSIGK